MKPVAFDYHRPASPAQAVRMLADLGEDAKIIAGGQSLLPIVNMRLAEPAHLIDIAGLRQLRGYQENDRTIVYGAAVTHMMVEEGLVPDACGGLLRQTASGIGYRAIRNRGTLGGSLAHADSSAEWPTVLSAVDAVVIAESIRGTREISVRELFRGIFTTTLASDEMIVGIRVPRLEAGTWWGICKTNRKIGEFAESIATVIHRRGDHEAITAPQIWLGAARDVPVRLSHVEEMVSGRPGTGVSVEELRQTVAKDLNANMPELDPHHRHRLQLHAVTVHRALSASRKAADDA